MRNYSNYVAVISVKYIRVNNYQTINWDVFPSKLQKDLFLLTVYTESSTVAGLSIQIKFVYA